VAAELSECFILRNENVQVSSNFALRARITRDIGEENLQERKDGNTKQAAERKNGFSDASYWLQSISGFIVSSPFSLLSAHDEIQSSGSSAAASPP